MSKAILVIDKPEFCSECLFCKTTKTNDIWEFEEQRCSFTNYIVEHSKPSKQPSCPLKEMPDFKVVSKDKAIDSYGRKTSSASFASGWNMCLSEILGE